MKNKSYIAVSFIVLVFGIWTVKEINERYFKKSSLFEVGTVPSFDLTNQNNQKITNENYLGKVYIVEFFFSTCPTICPKMNENMVKIQNKFLTEPNFGIVSITINPKYDTPEVLKHHAKQLQAIHKNWNFLTGDENYIYDIANKGFNMYAAQNNKAAGGFEHSGMFALIDKKGNIRCRKDDFGNPILYYDGLEEKGIKAITEDIKILLKE